MNRKAKRVVEKLAPLADGVVLLSEFSPAYQRPVFPSQRAIVVGATPSEGGCGKCVRLELLPSGTVVATFENGSELRRMFLTTGGWGWEPKPDPEAA